ncbi:DUF5908 family protein [Chryseolinea lacunae]|uniref:50S ribosomal protein L29 n=1 Tax=Chryseolinea lacunae TaxID=2801331 RepID=A0ABS1KPG3_9BACT|nr:DUF5908 family protein [Chryseolinea lacunae]MBL0741132.1 hypothetical protein [Chryseolinea lacunae]
MPIEIKELHIKAVVGGPAKPSGPTPEDLRQLKRDITKEVTEKILRTLRRKTER